MNSKENLEGKQKKLKERLTYIRDKFPTLKQVEQLEQKLNYQAEDQLICLQLATLDIALNGKDLMPEREANKKKIDELTAKHTDLIKKLQPYVAKEPIYKRTAKGMETTISPEEEQLSNELIKTELELYLEKGMQTIYIFCTTNAKP